MPTNPKVTPKVYIVRCRREEGIAKSYKDNMNAAYERVCANKGAGGVDDVTVEELRDYIKEHWNGIREQIRHRE